VVKRIFAAAVIGAALLLVPGAARADFTPAPPLAPLDPQHFQDQQTMTWNDYKPIPGHNWATDGRTPSVRAVNVAVVAFDFADQPFVITQPKGSDPFGNPQVDSIPRDQVPQFYADFYTKPEALNHYQTINGYWMEQSGGKIGIGKVTTFGPYRMPRKLSQYGLNDIGQNHGTTGDGCPGISKVGGAVTASTTVEVGDSSFFYVGDAVTFGTARTTSTIASIPDATHIVLAAPVTVAAGTAIEDCLNMNFDTDAANVWHAAANCTGNCGADIHLFVYAGYDETSVWQEFGEMMFQTKEDIPRAVWGNPNPAQPNWVISRYVDWTSWFAGEQQWGESSVRQGESSGTITHELSHNIFSVGDNNNNPYATPYHRVGSGPWDMMDRGSFNGPGGPHNRWEVPAQYGASMGAEHTLRSKIGMQFVDPKTVLTLNRNGLAQSGLAVTDVIARAVNTDPADLTNGVRAGVQVKFDGPTPIDHEPACDVNTNPLCDGGGAAGAWTSYMLETVQRIGYGSFEPDSGVLISKDKTWNPGVRGTEGSQCGYNCFTWVEDANPQDMNMVDYLKPDGTPVMRTVADYRQLDDALFHAGTNSGSKDEYDDAANSLKFYIVDKYTDDKGFLHYVLGIQNPAGAGPQTRGVSLADAPSQTLSGTNTNCQFQLTNSGTDAATDPSLHPQDETASFHNDIYRLEASVAGDGWTAQLRNALATARFGQSISVPVYVTRGAAPAKSATVTLKATSVSDASKTATATCALSAPTTDVSGTVPATLSLTLGGPATFGSFTPGVAKDYTASTTGNVISTAGDASLTVSDPGHLTNGTFSLPSPLGVTVTPNSWSGPVSNGAVAIQFSQHIGANDALRTGTYSKTVTFTLSTTTP
jgi:M6 family metalloprotease-like protein